MRWLVLAAVLLPFVDLWALFSLGGALGGWNAFGYALCGVVGGVLLTRAEGLRVLLRFRESLTGGEPPTDGVLSGILVVVGGLLLALPGPISDVFGIALFVPRLRRGLARWVRARFERRLAASTLHVRTVRVQGVPLGGVVDLGGFVQPTSRGPRGSGVRGGIIETAGEVVEPGVPDRPRLPHSR